MPRNYWKTDLLPNVGPVALLLERLAAYGLVTGRLGPDPADPWADFVGDLELRGQLPPVEDWLIGSDGDVFVTAALRRRDGPAAVLPLLLSLLRELVATARLHVGCEFATPSTGRRRGLLRIGWLGPQQTELTIRPPVFPWPGDLVPCLASAGGLAIAAEQTPYGLQVVATADSWRAAAGEPLCNPMCEAAVALPPEFPDITIARVVRIVSALGLTGPVGYEWEVCPRDMETDALAKQLRIYQQLRELQVPADKYKISLRIVLKGLDALEAMRPHLTSEGGEWTAGSFALPDGRRFGVEVVVRKKGYQVGVGSDDHTITAQELHALTGLRWR